MVSRLPSHDSSALPEPQWRDAAEVMLHDPLLEEIRRELEKVLLKRIYSKQEVDGSTHITSAQQATALMDIVDRVKRGVLR